jgi:hypothetical protein
MSRGNFRSGKDHGPAEVGSQRKIVDGWVMRKAGSLPTKEEAYLVANRFRRLFYFVRVIKGTKYWNVWRSYHTVKNQARIPCPIS